MFGWLTRRSGPAEPPPRAAATAHARRVEPPAVEPRFGLRCPLVGRSGSVAGFELQLPPAAGRRLAERGLDTATAAYHLALLAAAAPLAQAGRAAMLCMPAALLARPTVGAAAVRGTMLWLDDPTALPADQAAALKTRGVRLGAPDGPPAAQPAIDFVVLQARPGGIDTLLLSAQRWREQQPQLTVVVRGLAHLDDVERMLRSGVHLASGQIGRSAQPAPTRELGAAAHRVCALMNHLALDHDTAVIAEAVRGDVALTYRLLRYANSPAIGLRQAVETVDQAVAVLGRAELQRLLAVQLLATGATRQASRALQEVALARGRVLEAVARERGDPDPGAHFTLGMLSMIELLLQVPLAAAVEPLRLGEPAREALLHRRGAWASRLELLDAIDTTQAGRSEALAEALGVADALPGIVEEAWRWAADLTAVSLPERAA